MERTMNITRRTKKVGITISVKGKLTNCDIDNLVAALIPPDTKRAAYVRFCVAVLWQHLHPADPLPEDAITAIRTEYDCGLSSVVTTAICFAAGTQSKNYEIS
jgi:hypothetical protein